MALLDRPLSPVRATALTANGQLSPNTGEVSIGSMRVTEGSIVDYERAAERLSIRWGAERGRLYSIMMTEQPNNDFVRGVQLLYLTVDIANANIKTGVNLIPYRHPDRLDATYKVMVIPQSAPLSGRLANRELAPSTILQAVLDNRPRVSGGPSFFQVSFRVSDDDQSGDPRNMTDDALLINARMRGITLTEPVTRESILQQSALYQRPSTEFLGLGVKG